MVVKMRAQFICDLEEWNTWSKFLTLLHVISNLLCEGENVIYV